MKVLEKHKKRRTESKFGVRTVPSRVIDDEQVFRPLMRFGWIWLHHVGRRPMLGFVFALSVVSVHLAFIWIYWDRYIIQRIRESASLTRTVSIYCQIISHGLVLPLVEMTWWFRGRQRFRMFVEEMGAIDRRLSYLGRVSTIRRDHSRWWFILSSSILAFASSTVYHVYHNYSTTRDEIIPRIGFYQLVFEYPSIVQLYALSLLATVALLVGDRYSALNDLLSRALRRCDRVSEEFIPELGQIHGNIYLAVEKLSESLGLEIIVVIAFVLFHVIGNLYDMYNAYAFPCLGITNYEVIVNSFWLVARLTTVLGCTYSCSHARNQANETAVRLQETNIAKPMLRVEISTFRLQLIHFDLHFSLCGFFNVELSLIKKVVATVVTYLVIFIQMGARQKDCDDIDRND